MSTRALSSACEELARKIGIAPPVAEYRLRGNSRLTSRWTIPPADRQLDPLDEIVVSAIFSGAGTTVASVGGRSFKAHCAPKMLSVIPRGHDSQWRFSADVNASHVFIGHDRVQDCADQIAGGRAIELLARVNHLDSTLFAIMRLINRELEHPQHHSLMFMEHAVDALCLHLVRSHSSIEDPVVCMQRGLARWQVVKVVNYMRDNIGAALSLQDLADVVDMSRFHFCSAFRDATGMPPYEYLTRQRIRAACELLKDRRLPIRTIAAAVGYTTPSAFTATFHRMIGASPRQYRRES